MTGLRGNLVAEKTPLPFTPKLHRQDVLQGPASAEGFPMSTSHGVFRRLTFHSLTILLDDLGVGYELEPENEFKRTASRVYTPPLQSKAHFPGRQLTVLTLPPLLARVPVPMFDPRANDRANRIETNSNELIANIEHEIDSKRSNPFGLSEMDPARKSHERDPIVAH